MAETKPVGLDEPWVKAIVDGLVLALSADGVVEDSEVNELGSQLQQMLGQSGEAFDRDVRDHIQSTLSAIDRDGRDETLRALVPALPQLPQRQAALFMACIIACVDGKVPPLEAEFLTDYRRALGFLETDLVQALVEAQRFVSHKMSA